MPACEWYEDLLPQYVADGEPATRETAALRAHLASCPACADLLARLRHVEDALQTYPQPALPGALAAHVVAEVGQAGSREPGAWEWLPWNVWVPVLVLAIAVLLAGFSAPQQAFAPGPMVDLAPTADEWSATLDGWTSGLVASPHSDPLVLVWIGGSVLAAIAGMLIGLSAWRQADPTSHDLLQVRVERMAHWFGTLLGRST
jgi:anti-sigma factor RsiW